MSEEPEDPWLAHVSRFSVSGAQVTGSSPDGSLLVRHGLNLVVEEGRYETLVDNEAGKPAPSIMEYACFVRLADAAEPDSWTGTDMHVVVTGLHGNGWRITIAGPGAVGFDDKGSLEIHFDQSPKMAVHEVGAAVG